jgi:hypothetical protein
MPLVNADCSGACLSGFISINGVCVNSVYGCMDSTAVNFNPSANINEVSALDNSNPCSYGVLGCTISSACNYDSLATLNDGSCVMPGCTDTLACNYDANAGCDDGTCDLPNGCGDILYRI